MDDPRALRLCEFSVNLGTYWEAEAACGVAGVVIRICLVPGRSRSDIGVGWRSAGVMGDFMFTSV